MLSFPPRGCVLGEGGIKSPILFSPHPNPLPTLWGEGGKGHPKSSPRGCPGRGRKKSPRTGVESTKAFRGRLFEEGFLRFKNVRDNALSK